MSMSISLADLNFVLSQAREFYKGGIKTSNKVYFNTQNATNTGADDRKLLRNANSPLASRIMKQRRALEPTDLPYAELGERLVRRKHTAGNCGEMSAVVAHFCLRYPGFSAKCKDLWMVTIQSPVDHAFIMIHGHGNHSRQHRYTNILQMSSVPIVDYWVIDCWLNIACTAANYNARIQTKLQQWWDQGKAVTVGANSFNAGRYHSMLINAPISVYEEV